MEAFEAGTLDREIDHRARAACRLFEAIDAGNPDLERLHRRLVAESGAVGEIEGEAYTPHVTLARGGSIDAARELTAGVEIAPIEWTVSELRLFDPRDRETIGRVSLSD